MTPERDLREVWCQPIRTGGEEPDSADLRRYQRGFALCYGPGYGLKISSTEGEGTAWRCIWRRRLCRPMMNCAI
ncbi:MAG: hypothetical protein ACLUTA_16315 [Blautia wexlerae]